MALKSKTLPWGGMTIKCKDFLVGCDDANDAGTNVTADQLEAVAALTAANIANLGSVTGNVVQMKEVTFTETSGAGEYTGSVTVPAGAYLIDVIVHGVAVWDNAGAVDMDVGFAGGTELFDITSLKAAGDLLAGESISFGTGSDGGEGGSTASTNFARYLATERVITGAITTASTGGSTGRTRMVVLYALPSAANTSAAVKV
jgi:hypothetical protein